MLGAMGAGDSVRPDSAPSEGQPAQEDDSTAEPPMWLMADACGELLPDRPEAEQSSTGNPAQPRRTALRRPPEATPRRPPDAALRLVVPGALAAALRPYQREGVRFLFRHALETFVATAQPEAQFVFVLRSHSEVRH